MAKCNIVRIEENKDQFTVLLKDMTQNDVNNLCYGLSELADQRQQIGASKIEELFEVINNERIKQ